MGEDVCQMPSRHTIIKADNLLGSSYTLVIAYERNMIVSFILVLFLLTLVSSQSVADVSSHYQQRSRLLKQAIEHLVNYTTTEAKTHLDLYNIESAVAAIAYEQLTKKLGRYYKQ